VKPDDGTLLMIPVDPPSAGPDRALDPPPVVAPPARPPGDALGPAAAEEGVAAEEEAVIPTGMPIAAHTTAAAPAIHTPRFDSHRCDEVRFSVLLVIGGGGVELASGGVGGS
jgi:hypothetical protein